MKNHHYRSNYEALLVRLKRETGEADPIAPKYLSDYALLLQINNYLIRIDCLPMEVEELKRDLKTKQR